MKASETVSVISPRLRNPDSWNEYNGYGNPETDYAFITVDRVVRPNDYLTPLNYESDEILTADSTGDIDVNLFRPKTVFAVDQSGHPVETLNEYGNLVFDKSTRKKGADFFENLDSAQKVNRRCSLINASLNDGAITNDCPTETGVSGSPFTTSISNEDYLIGLHVSSSGNINISSDDERKGAGQFIMTKQFCDDFQTACGKPCPSLRDVLQQSSETSL